ncbi:MAG TPA: condensation domain-containing protein, partial [Candidatus Angelobacter sp.]|nr:condensation domain-containing protein [Candidatus Angelobacter sp.]
MKNVEDIYPLSPMQEGMLFHTLYAPGSGAYVVHISSRIEGDLNIDAFKRAWQKILDRHPILRSAYLWDKVDKPLQVVRTGVTLPWYEPDWRGLPAQQQEQQLQDYLWSEHSRGFDLSQ